MSQHICLVRSSHTQFALGLALALRGSRNTARWHHGTFPHPCSDLHRQRECGAQQRGGAAPTEPPFLFLTWAQGSPESKRSHANKERAAVSPQIWRIRMHAEAATPRSTYTHGISKKCPRPHLAPRGTRFGRRKKVGGRGGRGGNLEPKGLQE